MTVTEITRTVETYTADPVTDGGDTRIKCAVCVRLMAEAVGLAASLAEPVGLAGSVAGRLFLCLDCVDALAAHVEVPDGSGIERSMIPTPPAVPEPSNVTAPSAAATSLAAVPS